MINLLPQGALLWRALVGEKAIWGTVLSLRGNGVICGLTAYSHFKENLLVVSNIYSCHMSRSRNTPGNFDFLLGSLFFQECFRYFYNIKIIIKN